MLKEAKTDTPHKQIHDHSLSWVGTGTSIKRGRTKEKFEDIKGLIRSRTSKTERQYNDQRNKTLQRNDKSTKTNLIKTEDELRCSGKESSPHAVPSCYSCYVLGDRSWMREGPDCDYSKQNMSLVLW